MDSRLQVLSANMHTSGSLSYFNVLYVVMNVQPRRKEVYKIQTKIIQFNKLHFVNRVAH